MAGRRKFKELAEAVEARPGATERLAKLRAETLQEIALYELRKATQLSQVEVAAALGITQGAVSQLERGGDNMGIDTVRKYVEALGAELHCTAVFETDDGPLEVPIMTNTPA